MIFLGDLQETQESNILKPCFIHYCPFDKDNGLNKTEKELKEDGILIEYLPEAENKEGFYSEIRVNKETKEVFYIYNKIKKEGDLLTAEQLKIKNLENRIELMQKALDELSMGGM
ncbi:hypothetical protein [Clostridium ihumii]|uniref:hypothetical protein n=1 Tax=Clostridium ihumii TaxID=1470356 RepID=UPI003D3537A6